jgi:hypothetical protein
MIFDFNQISEFKELTLIGGHLADDESFGLSVEYLTQHQNELKYLISNVVGFEKFYNCIYQPTLF